MQMDQRPPLPKLPGLPELPEGVGANENDWKEYWSELQTRNPDRFPLLVSQYYSDEPEGNVSVLMYFIRGSYKMGAAQENSFMLNLANVARGFYLVNAEQERSSSETIQQALSAVSPVDDGTHFDSGKIIQNLEVVVDGESKRSYFIADDSLSFRHQGDLKKKPRRVFLRNLARYDDKVLVYYAASGSGKTVELAGSSATRDAHITFIVSVNDPPEDEFVTFKEQAGEQVDGPNVVGDTFTHGEPVEDGVFIERQINKLAADFALAAPLDTLVKKAKDELQRVTEAAGENESLRIVLAIDEGSRCTRLIRGFLRFGRHVQDLVQSTFSNNYLKFRNLKVQISVAGTGLASSTIGSVPTSFEVIRPYHETEGKERVYEDSLALLNKKLLVPWSPDFVRINSFQLIQDHLPVVGTLMQNGRMASIAIFELGKYEDCDSVCETTLVDRIVKSFMQSNGMSGLVGRDMSEKRQFVAAAAMAVHLFGKLERFKISVPLIDQDVINFARNMLFFPLETQTSITTLLEIVATYGLLEPSDVIKQTHRGASIAPPLKMQTAQQLVAAHMLGIGLKSMLEPSWIGFEIMSTHFVRCAIAASVAVQVQHRPSLAEALTCLGFQLDGKATSEEVRQIWEDMEKWKPIGARAGAKTWFHSETRQLQAGLEIVNNCYLLTDKILQKSIGDLNPIFRPGTSTEFAPPISCVNYDNSDLPDGWEGIHRAGKMDDDDSDQRLP